MEGGENGQVWWQVVAHGKLYAMVWNGQNDPVRPFSCAITHENGSKRVKRAPGMKTAKFGGKWWIWQVIHGNG